LLSECRDYGETHAIIKGPQVAHFPFFEAAPG